MVRLVRTIARCGVVASIICIGIIAFSGKSAAQGPVPLQLPPPASAVKEPPSPEADATTKAITNALGFDRYTYNALKLPGSMT